MASWRSFRTKKMSKICCETFMMHFVQSVLLPFGIDHRLKRFCNTHTPPGLLLADIRVGGEGI